MREEEATSSLQDGPVHSPGFCPGQPLPTSLEDQPCAIESVVQVMGETVRVGSSEALCCGSYVHLLGHSPGKSVTGSPAEEAMHGGAEQNQQLD